MKFKKIYISFRSNFPLLQHGLYIVHKTVIRAVQKNCIWFAVISVDVAGILKSSVDNSFHLREWKVIGHKAMWIGGWIISRPQWSLEFVTLCSFAVRLKETLHHSSSFPNLPTWWIAYQLKCLLSSVSFLGWWSLTASLWTLKYFQILSRWQQLVQV